MRNRSILISAIFLTYSMTWPAAAAHFDAADANGVDQGAIIMRIADDSGVCINRTTDSVTLGMVDFVTSKDATWFTEQQDATLTTTITLNGANTVNGATTPANTAIASSIKTALSSFSDNQPAHIAYQANFLELYQLKRASSQISSISFKIDLIKDSGDSPAVSILKNMSSAIGALPLPTSPFTEGYSVATKYVSSVFGPVLSDAEQAQDTFGGQQITFNFGNVSSNCGPTDEKTGTVLIVYSAGNQSAPGYIDIGNISQYCSPKISLTPTFNIQIKATSDSGGCTDSSGYVQMQNQYIAFYLSAETSSGGAAAGAARAQAFNPNSRTAQLNADAARRCQLLGLNPARCQGRH